VVGEALAAARQRAGITQRGLAAALGKPQPFESAFENGQRRIDLLEFIAIAEALAADPSIVFGDIVANWARSSRHTST
jgi:transcriptional regulator with XRE-family HTH domain